MDGSFLTSLPSAISYPMIAPAQYVCFPGTARKALEFYADVLGADVRLNTSSEFSRTDGPSDAIARGVSRGGPVSLFGSDAAGDEPSVHVEGVLLSPLGTACDA